MRPLFRFACTVGPLLWSLVPATGFSQSLPGLSKKKGGLEPARLSYVSPAVRTQTKRGEWLEALPDQAVEPNTNIATGKAGGAEISVGSEVHLTIDPTTALLVKKLPRGGRGPAELTLSSGTILVEVDDKKGIGPLTVHTSDGEIKLRGATARITSDGPGRVSVAVYQGTGVVRIRGVATEIGAGRGALLLPAPGPRGTPLPLRELPPAPGWPDGYVDTPNNEAQRGLLVPALSSLQEASTSSELRIDWKPPAGAAGYLVELAKDPRFTERRVVTELAAPSLRTQLPPGLHYVRITAFDSAHILGPTSAERPVYLVPLLTNARLADAVRDEEKADKPALLRLSRRLNVTLRAVGGGLPLRLGTSGRAAQDCSGECMLRLGPGEHRVTLSLNEVKTSLNVSVLQPPAAPPPPPEPPPIEDQVEPIEISAPLLAHGFPTRTIDPRTRAYGLFGFGATDDKSALNVVRLDVGGEIMLIRRRLSLDINIPLLYYLDFPTELGDKRSGLGLGDIAVGGRFVAGTAMRGALRVGPMLRLQIPTGTYERGPGPTHPVVIDPAVGLSVNLGRLGLLTSQALPISVNIAPVELRWAMSYLAQVRLGRLAFLGQLDAAIGLSGNVPSGAALGGGLRIHLGQKETWRILLGARGGLASAGQSLFGRYTTAIGLEWFYQ